MIWASDALNRLKELARLGLSSTRIAEQLGVTKNAVNGAIYRHVAEDKPPPPPPPELKWPNATQCRFILDDGPWRTRPPVWCARPVQPGSAYCPEHYRRCYLKRP